MLKKVEGKGKTMKYLIRKDKVKVPTNLPTGDYVLSFRWNIMQSYLIFVTNPTNISVEKKMTNTWNINQSSLS